MAEHGANGCATPRAKPRLHPPASLGHTVSVLCHGSFLDVPKSYYPEDGADSKDSSAGVLEETTRQE